MDSPALNANSRAVLVPLARPQLSTAAIVVSGPGPIEPHTRDQLTDESVDAQKSESKVQSQGIDLLGDENSTTAEGAQDGRKDEYAQTDVDGDGDDDDIGSNTVADPYANLDGAFGGYLADQPRPMAGRQRGNNDLDDLLI